MYWKTKDEYSLNINLRTINKKIQTIFWEYINNNLQLRAYIYSLFSPQSKSELEKWLELLKYTA